MVSGRLKHRLHRAYCILLSFRKIENSLLQKTEVCGIIRIVTTNPDYRTPGQYIKALLDERGWSQRVLAIVLDISEAATAKILAGKQRVDAELAISLGEAFGVEPTKFMELQASYDLGVARVITRPDPSREARAYLFGDLPVTDMIKRGWITADSVKDVPTVEAELTRFFQAGAVSEIEILPHAAKKTNVSEDATPSQLAWLYRVREIASEMIVPRYSPESVQNAIVELKALTRAPEEARKVPRVLAECGIRFLIVESLPSAKIDGVCFWLNDNSPVIAMTLRFDRIDNFWFVLRHELEHVLRQDGLSRSTIMLDTELIGEGAEKKSVLEEERLANEAAVDFCVPRKKIESFIARKGPFFAERDFLAFVNTIKVHPGIVAGLLQHEIGRYDLFRNHLSKIREHVAPSAVVDGWGDVYPLGI